MPFDSLKRRVLRIPNLKTRNKLLSQFNRLVTIESTSVTKDAQGKFPELIKGQVVRANFIGQGSVLDGNHPAVVWEVRDDREHVVLLPLTSKTRNDRFEIGNIIGFEGDSIIKTNQPQSVSRKGISTVYVTDSSGNQLLDRLGQPIPSLLSPKQLEKVHDLFLISQLGLPTLKDVINNKIDMRLPIQLDEFVINQLERPVFFGFENNDLIIKFYHSEILWKITLADIGLTTFRERRHYLGSLLSQNPEIRSESNKQVVRLLVLQQSSSSQIAATQNSEKDLTE